jgi:four helix bundle protein
MSDFRNLLVYQKARSLNKDIYKLMRDPSYDRTIRHQLTRASTSIMLNIAEGGGRFSKKDQRNFFVIARASAMECMALFDIIEDLKLMGMEETSNYRNRYIEISKMLFGMIKRLSST